MTRRPHLHDCLENALTHEKRQMGPSAVETCLQDLAHELGWFLWRLAACSRHLDLTPSSVGLAISRLRKAYLVLFERMAHSYIMLCTVYYYDLLLNKDERCSVFTFNPGHVFWKETVSVGRTPSKRTTQSSSQPYLPISMLDRSLSLMR